MSRYVIENRLSLPEQLTRFDVDGYVWDQNLSNETELVFKRHER